MALAGTMADSAKNEQSIRDDQVGLGRRSSIPPKRISSLQIPVHKSNPAVWQAGNAPAELVVIPRSERRGLFGTLTLVPEVEDAWTYSNRVKWFLTFIIALAGAAGPTGSAIFYRESLENK